MKLTDKVKMLKNEGRSHAERVDVKLRELVEWEAELQHVVSGYEKMQAEYNADTEKLINTQLELAAAQSEISRLRNIMHQMQRTVADCATDVSRWHDTMNNE